MLSLAPNGGFVCVSRAGQVNLVQVEREAVVDVALPGLVAAFAFDDQAWLVTSGGGGGLAVERRAWSGACVGAPLELGALGESATVRGVARGAALLVEGSRRVEVRGDARRLHGVELDAGWTRLVPLTPRVFVGERQGRLWLRAFDEERPLGVPEALLAEASLAEAWPMWEGASLLLQLRGAERHELVLVGTRDGAVQGRRALSPACVVRVATTRGHAILREGERSLEVVDLRFMRTLKAWMEPRPLVDLAVDAKGQRVVVERPPCEGESSLALLPYKSWLADGAPWEGGCEAPPPVEEPAGAAPPCAWVPVEAAAPTVEEEPDAAALAALPVQALWPRPPAPPPDEAARVAALDEALELVAAWCKRAIAEAWDTGRLSQPAPARLPFFAEVGAILDGKEGLAGEVVDQARARVLFAQRQHRARLAAGASALARLAAELGLSPLATDILLIVAAPGLWGELTRAYAIVSNDPARPVCDELLVAQILGVERADRAAIARELDAGAPLQRHGLVRVGREPRPFAALSVPSVALRRIAGEALDSDETDSPVRLRAADRALDQLLLPRGCLSRVAQAVAARGETPLRLVLRGRQGSGRRSVMAALAEQAGRRLGVIDGTTLSRERGSTAALLGLHLQETALRGWLPCVIGLEFLVAADPHAEEQLRHVLAAHAGPIVVCAGAGERPPLDPGYVSIDVAALSEEERARAWREALARQSLPVEMADRLAAKYRIGPGTITRVVRGLELDGEVSAERCQPRVEAAVRQHRAARLGTLATRIERLASWSSVVLPGEIHDSLREFIGRLRHRRTVFERWGYDQLISSARGLTALFQGGPGTGKSMVAGVIARELGYELYRIDLGRMLSKWIGETEKNLGALFDAAEEGEVVLLFDEADALFGKRTEVRSSVDRYANMEVNYLLQRLDTFEGIAILTTNLGTSIDAAFKRRLSLRLSFPFPDEEMREQLWRAHLPPELPIEGELDLRALAERYRLSGGYIRNVALRAAFLAAQEERALTQQHLERAVRLEYREVGKITDDGTLE